jgi:hypothetical protein
MKQPPMTDGPTSTEIRQLLEDLSLGPEFRHRMELLLEATLAHERVEAEQRSQVRAPYRDD